METKTKIIEERTTVNCDLKTNPDGSYQVQYVEERNFTYMKLNPKSTHTSQKMECLVDEALSRKIQTLEKGLTHNMINRENIKVGTGF